MPELPEVETIVRGLRPKLTGRRIADRLQIDPRSTRTPVEGFSRLAGLVVEEVARRGKFVCVGFHGGGPLVIHLGMTGRLGMVSITTALPTHTHMCVGIEGSDRVELRFTNPRWCMGGLWMLLGGEDPSSPIAKLGAEPLDIDRRAFGALLTGAQRQIKGLLLDQRRLAGLGNIYVDESLFAAGIHPRTRSDRIEDSATTRLWAAMGDRLRAAIEAGGSTLRDYRNADGVPGRFQDALAIYGRMGLPCHRCGHPVERTVVAGRSTHFCPQCQRGAPTGRT